VRRFATAVIAGIPKPVLTLVIAGLLMAPGVPAVFAPGGATVAMLDATDAELAAAWRARRLEVERRRGVERFAERYRIGEDLADQIHRAAVGAAIEPGLAFGLISVESSFRRTAVSHAGAVGYTQLLPSTARWLVPGTTRSQLINPDTNLEIGFRYLRYLLDYYDGDVRLALTAYNRGPGTVDRLVRQGRNPENGYAERVLRRRS
jgi:soluble lytic murein transglycosylase-like protein